MATTEQWRTVREAFQSLLERVENERLRAEHHPAGRGASARDMLARLDAGDPEAQPWSGHRSVLEADAAAPCWWLAGDSGVASEFMQFAGEGAALTGYAGADGWLVWLDRLLGAKLNDGRRVGEMASNSASARHQITTIPNVIETSVQYCRLLELQDGNQAEQHAQQYPSAIARNIDTLRLDCGWSFDTLCARVGVAKDTVLATVNKGAQPQPKTLKAYADCFSDELKRPITVADLQK